MSKTTNKFAPEVRERAVRLVLDQEHATSLGRLATRLAQKGADVRLHRSRRQLLQRVHLWT